MDYDEIVHGDNKCPYCKFEVDISWGSEHTVDIACHLCGYAETVIDPREGFEIWELGDFDEEHDDLEDAITEKEREVLQDRTRREPTLERLKYVVPILKVYGMGGDCRGLVKDYYESDDSLWSLHPFKDKQDMFEVLFESWS